MSRSIGEFQQYARDTVFGAEHHHLARKHVLLASFPRSGNSWLSAVVAATYAMWADGGHASIPDNIGALVHEVVPDLHKTNPLAVDRSYLLQRFLRDRPVFAKSHSMFALSGADSAVLLVRDPADTLVSYWTFAKNLKEVDDRVTLDEFATAALSLWVEYHTRAVERLSARRRTFVLDYSDMHRDALTAVGSMFAFFDLHPPHEIVRAAVNAASADRLRQFNPVGIGPGVAGASARMGAPLRGLVSEATSDIYRRLSDARAVASGLRAPRLETL